MLGKSPAWQDAGGACSGYLVEEGGHRVLLDCGNGVFGKLRELRRLRRRRRGRHLAPARRPLPRPRAVRLRADLRAAPAARAGRPLAGHRHPARPRCTRRPGAARRLPARRRRVGQRGPDRERVRRCASTTRPTRSSRAAARALPARCRTSSPTQRGRGRPRDGGGAPHLRRRLRAERRAVRVRARHRPAADRGHAAAARARRACAATSRRRRPASTGAAPGARRLVLTHISDELDARLGARGGRARRSAARSTSPARARSTRSDRATRLQPGGRSADKAAERPLADDHWRSERRTDGVRLLSHRPSVLYKVEHLATEPAEGDIAVEGLELAGPGWDERLKELLERALASPSARACSRVRLADEQALPLPAETLLDRARTDWFPEFLSHGQMTAALPADRRARRPAVSFGREALMRGKLGAVEVRGGELLAAAEAHDALFSFDSRARAAALEIGLPLLPEGEVLFVNLDPRARARRRVLAAHDLAGRRPARRRPVADLPRARAPRALRRPRHARRPGRRPPQARRADRARRPLRRHRVAALPRGCCEPDVAKIDNALTAGIQHSAGRRRLVAALVECAHERGARSSPRASSGSTSSRRCATSASTSARASTSASRPSARWRSTRGSSARGPSSCSGAPHRGGRSIDSGSAVGSRPVRQLRAHAARDGRAVRRLVRRRLGPRAAARSRPPSTSTTLADPPRAVVRAELAGITPREIELEIRGRELILAGRRRRARRGEERVYQQLEVQHGPFRRVVALGADVDADARARRPTRTASSRRAADRRPPSGSRTVPIAAPGGEP